MNLIQKTYVFAGIVKFIMYKLLLILFFTCFFSDVYDYTDIPDEYDTFEIAEFRIYIPRDIDTLRGI